MFYRNRKLICFIGTDGSGKSTLAHLLEKELKKNGINKTHLTWAAYDLILLRPIITLFRHLLLRSPKNYKELHKNVVKLGKNGIYSSLYIYLTIAEYMIQILLKVKIPMTMGRMVICDRYVYDTVVNFAVNFALNRLQIQRMLNLFGKLCPTPDLVVWVDVPENVSLTRKNDIPDSDYIKFRREEYKKIFCLLKVPNLKLDGTKPPEELFEKLKQKI